MRSNRWLIGGLVLSVIFNLLLAGFVVGRLSGIGPPPGFGPDPTVGFVRMLGFLDDGRRASLRGQLREQLSAMMPMVRQMRRNQTAVLDALTREPFDRQALAASLDTLLDNLTAAQRESHKTFVALASELTATERGQLAREMRRTSPMRRHGRPSEGGDHPPLGVQGGRRGLDTPQEIR
jgi:uncharacterized membrane protein